VSIYESLVFRLGNADGSTDPVSVDFALRDVFPYRWLRDAKSLGEFTDFEVGHSNNSVLLITELIRIYWGLRLTPKEKSFLGCNI